MIKRTTVCITCDKKLLQKIDSAKGFIPRSRYFEIAAVEFLKSEASKFKKSKTDFVEKSAKPTQSPKSSITNGKNTMHSKMVLL